MRLALKIDLHLYYELRVFNPAAFGSQGSWALPPGADIDNL